MSRAIQELRKLVGPHGQDVLDKWLKKWVNVYRAEHLISGQQIEYIGEERLKDYERHSEKNTLSAMGIAMHSAVSKITEDVPINPAEYEDWYRHKRMYPDAKVRGPYHQRTRYSLMVILDKPLEEKDEQSSDSRKDDE